MMWYWYSPNPREWYRAELVGSILSIMTLRVLLTGEQVSGRARRIGRDAWILEA